MRACVRARVCVCAAGERNDVSFDGAIMEKSNFSLDCTVMKENNFFK
jgi:hypothetical protein